MNFDLSDEQRLLQQTLDQYLSDHCPPGRVRALAEAESDYDPELWKGLCELGLTGLLAPEAYGGAGLEVLDLACAAETLGYHAMPGPFLGHALVIRALALGGTREQQQRWLPRLASGELVGTVALAEPDGAWSPDQWGISAGAELVGRKTFVPGADRADLVLVGLSGGRLGIVETVAEGFQQSRIDAADWTRRLADLELARCACELLPEVPGLAQQVFDTGLVLIAADAFGGGKRLLEMCTDYALTREQFGVKIATFQALKHQLADMALRIEPNRGLYWYAAHLVDQGDADASRLASLAKAHNSDRFIDAARAAVEIHGGIGFTWEGDVQIWFKRALFDRAFLGTPSQHRRRQALLGGWSEAREPA